MKLLTLGISTVISRHEAAISVLKNAAHLFDECVVVVQLSKDNRVEIDGNIKTIFVSDAGLSKSRNLLLDNAETRWLWINDDDVEVLYKHVQIVRKKINSAKKGTVLFAGRIGCIGSSGCYKNYKYRWIKPLLYAQVSSVEMIVDRIWCNGNSVRFDVEFGLGGLYPVAEEPIFAANIVRRGGCIEDISEITVNHPCGNISKAANLSWSASQLSYSRGKAAARISGWRGTVFFTFAIFSSIARGRSIRSLKKISTGYFSGVI